MHIIQNSTATTEISYYFNYSALQIVLSPHILNTPPPCSAVTSQDTAMLFWGCNEKEYNTQLLVFTDKAVTTDCQHLCVSKVKSKVNLSISKPSHSSSMPSKMFDKAKRKLHLLKQQEEENTFIDTSQKITNAYVQVTKMMLLHFSLFMYWKVEMNKINHGTVYSSVKITIFLQSSLLQMHQDVRCTKTDRQLNNNKIIIFYNCATLESISSLESPRVYLWNKLTILHKESFVCCSLALAQTTSYA